MSRLIVTVPPGADTAGMTDAVADALEVKGFGILPVEIIDTRRTEVQIDRSDAGYTTVLVLTANADVWADDLDPRATVVAHASPVYDDAGEHDRVVELGRSLARILDAQLVEKLEVGV